MRTICFDDFAAQGSGIEAIRSLIDERRMVHALLITGEKGTGKRTLAMLFSRALLCRAEKGAPCGQCTGCRMALSEEHPDITVVEKGIPLSADTAKGRATIPVDDIREVIRLCSRFSFEGGNRVVVIINAEDMTVQAQNSLLKILEEPPQNTYFILTSANPDQLLTTVRSRCRPLKLGPWDSAYICKILMDDGVEKSRAEQAAVLSAGSIGESMRRACDEEYWKLCSEVSDAFFRNRKRSDILTVSGKWKDRKEEAVTIYAILEHNVHLLFQARFMPEKQTFLKDFPPEWQRFAAFAPPERFVFLNEMIREARKRTSNNVNFQATIEQLLLVFLGESDQWQQ